MIVTYGFCREDECFKPYLDVDASNEAWVDVDVDLPRYIDRRCFVNNVHKITSLKHYGFNFKQRLLTKQTFQRLLTLDGFDLFCVAKLLSTRKRSAVLTTVKSQTISWMQGRSKFFRPWSHRQGTVLKDMWFDEYRACQHTLRKHYRPISSFT